MRTSKITALAVAGVLGVAGLGAVAVGGPALAGAVPTASATEDATGQDAATGGGSESAPEADESGLTDRLARIKDALAGLVSDGTITTEQADAVAGTLAESAALPGRSGHGEPGAPGDPGAHGPGAGGPGDGRGGERPGHLIGQGLDAAATALGLSETEVRDAVRDGQTLADLARAQEVEVQTVVDALVAEGQQALADEVADGRITQERADEIAATLPGLVADVVENGLPERGGSPHS